MTKVVLLGSRVTVWFSYAILPDSTLPYRKNAPTSLNLSTTGILKGPSESLFGMGIELRTSIKQGPLYQLSSLLEWMLELVMESIGINSTDEKPQEDSRKGVTWLLIRLYLSCDH